jgi:site-specific DNA-cytosine methylase
VKDVPSVGTLIGGFPCKDVSLLNPKRASFADVVAQGGGKTGSAFKGILDYCRAHPEQLRCLILENVAGLDNKTETKGEEEDSKERQKAPLSSAGGSDLDVVLASLEELGFFAFALKLHAKHFGHPQSRPRLYTQLSSMRS